MDHLPRGYIPYIPSLYTLYTLYTLLQNNPRLPRLCLVFEVMFNEFCFSHSIEPNAVEIQDINLSFIVTKETVHSMLQGEEGTRRVQGSTNHGRSTLWESSKLLLYANNARICEQTNICSVF